MEKAQEFSLEGADFVTFQVEALLSNSANSCPPVFIYSHNCCSTFEGSSREIDELIDCARCLPSTKGVCCRGG